MGPLLRRKQGLMKYLIIVSGPQGSGKTTQAENISKKYSMPLFDAGMQLRSFVESQAPGAQEVEKSMNEGILVPHHYVDELFRQFLAANPEAPGYLTDGFPRSLEQWHIIQETIDKLDAKVIGVYIALTEEVAINRITKRVEMIDGVAEKRGDDTPDAIRRRFQVYHKETVPVLNYIREHHQLIEIDGSPSAEEVKEAVLNKLNLVLNG